MGLSFVEESPSGRTRRTRRNRTSRSRIFRILKLESIGSIHPEWEALAKVQLIAPVLS